MKAYNLLLLTILSAPLLIDSQANNVPDCSSYPNGVYLPDSFSCTNYFECRNGVALIRRCAWGFRFDDTVMYCNFAALVDCSRVTRANGRALTTAPPGNDSSECATTTVACPTITTTCTTTTCTPPPCTTSTCTTTATCTPTPCTTSTCTTSTCTTTATCTPTPCTTSTCTTTATCTPTPCTTSTCTTTATCTPTPCPIPEPEPEPCPPTPEPETCSTPTTCSVTPTPCPQTDAPIAPVVKPLYYYRHACRNLTDGTKLPDRRNYHRYYFCYRSKGRRLSCNRGDCFDYTVSQCVLCSQVTNLQASCN